MKTNSLGFLVEHFGKSGPYFYGIAGGVDERQVRPDRVRKSIGAEDTFLTDITDLEVAMEELRALVVKVWSQCEEKGFSGKTVTVKVKYSDFTQATRGRTSSMSLAGGDDMLKAAKVLLTSVYPFKRPVRLLGVTLPSLTNDKGSYDEAQLGLGLGV